MTTIRYDWLGEPTVSPVNSTIGFLPRSGLGGEEFIYRYRLFCPNNGLANIEGIADALNYRAIPGHLQGHEVPQKFVAAMVAAAIKHEAIVCEVSR